MALVVVLALTAVACGGEAAVAPAPTTSPDSPAATTPPETGQTTPAETSPAETTSPPAPPIPGPPSIAALTSGRGDDGSLEIGIWFAADPFADGAARLLVGTDADGSYPGVGDPRPHIDGWAEITDTAVSLIDDGATVVDTAGGGLDDWFSWTGPDRVIWVYFLGNVPVRAGTVWVALEVDGEVVAAGIAGAPMGDGCSFHTAGVEVGSVPGDVPDFGVPCRYPLG